MTITYDIYLALMKIARETGEEKYESIHLLKDRYDVCITSEETSQFMNNPKKIIILHEEIFGDLKMVHCIDLEVISESDWGVIMNSKFWKNAQFQVARELIANDILSNLL